MEIPSNLGGIQSYKLSEQDLQTLVPLSPTPPKTHMDQWIMEPKKNTITLEKEKRHRSKPSFVGLKK